MLYSLPYEKNIKTSMTIKSPYSHSSLSKMNQGVYLNWDSLILNYLLKQAFKKFYFLF